MFPGNWKGLKLEPEGPSDLPVDGYQGGKVVKPNGDRQMSAHDSEASRVPRVSDRTLSSQHQKQCLAHSRCSIQICQMNGDLRTPSILHWFPRITSQLSTSHPPSIPLSIEYLCAYHVGGAKLWAIGDSRLTIYNPLCEVRHPCVKGLFKGEEMITGRLDPVAWTQTTFRYAFPSPSTLRLWQIPWRFSLCASEGKLPSSCPDMV